MGKAGSTQASTLSKNSVFTANLTVSSFLHKVLASCPYTLIIIIFHHYHHWWFGSPPSPSLSRHHHCHHSDLLILHSQPFCAFYLARFRPSHLPLSRDVWATWMDHAPGRRETWLHWIIYNHCTESLHWITHLVEERLGPGKVYSGFCRRTNKHKSNQKSRTWQKRDLAALKARTSSKLSTSPHYHKVVSAVQLFRICLLCQLLKEDPVKMIQLDIDLPASQNRRLYDQWVESLLLWQAFCQ